MGKVKVAQHDYMFTFYLTLPRPTRRLEENLLLEERLFGYLKK